MADSGNDLCQYPALAPPEGIVPNFDDPATLGPVTVVVSSILTAIALIFVTGRLVANRKNLKLGDYFVIISFAFSVALFVTVVGCESALLTMSHGPQELEIDKRWYLRHQWDIPWLFAQGLLIPLAISFAKAAILLLYRQIFSIDKKMRIAVYVGLVLNFVIYGVSMILVPFMKSPRIGETYPDFAVNDQPEKIVVTGAGQGSLAVILDLYILMLPIPKLAGLKLQSQKKLRLFAIFGTATLGVVASALALVYRVRIMQSADTTWAEAQAYICIMTENYIALIVASMPAFTTFYGTHIRESALFKTLSEKVKMTRTGSIVSKWPSRKRSGQDAMSMELPNDSLELHTHNWSGSTATLDAQAGTLMKPQPQAVYQAGIIRTVEVRQTSQHGHDMV